MALSWTIVTSRTLVSWQNSLRTEQIGDGWQTVYIESFIDYIVALHLVGARNAYHTYI